VGPTVERQTDAKKAGKLKRVMASLMRPSLLVIDEYSGLRDTSVRAFRNRYSGK